MRNLGPRSQAMLRVAGIESIEQLRELGAVGAYVQVKRVQPEASLNLLYALVGALEDIAWQDVKRTRKLELLLTVEVAERELQKRSGR